ncbi:MAG TPA: hypothetical protein VHE61_00220, partial [Opitutaceae bacterium]|nr:hypothetical protein [Opitutaceae bacterium]
AAAGLFAMTKLQLGIGLAIVAGGCAGLVWQHRANVRLRAEVTGLRQQIGQAEARSAAERALTASGPRSAAAQTTIPAPARAPDPASGAVGQEQASPAKSDVALAAGLVSVESLGNAGRATPEAAFATQLWAARTGDIETESSVLLLTPTGRSTLEQLLAKLPATVTSHYDTPEKLMAFALAGSPHPVGGMEVVGQTEQGPDDVVLQTRWQHTDDAIVHQVPVRFHHTSDGWKMVVPTILVDRVAAYLSSNRM